ncbi:MAG: hypothetical protein Q9213_001448 [Squamulea squamosa]
MSHSQLQNSYDHIRGLKDSLYGRHRVDRELKSSVQSSAPVWATIRHSKIQSEILTSFSVADAWEILGDPERWREYHRRLRLPEPPKERGHLDGRAADDKDDGLHDIKSVEGSVIVGQDPRLVLDDPFVDDHTPRQSKHTKKPSDPAAANSRTTSVSSLPQMRVFHTSVKEGQATISPANSAGAHRLSPVLPPRLPAAAGRQLAKNQNEERNMQSDIQAAQTLGLMKSVMTPQRPTANGIRTEKGAATAQENASGDDDTFSDGEETDTRIDRWWVATTKGAQDEDTISADEQEVRANGKRGLSEDGETVVEVENIKKFGRGKVKKLRS